ncbi:MAG TPA: HAD family hydrolase [Anaerolineae bacterium]|nr:HAD family hydrolase [Anaerolineae bacterium]HMR63590.1 HAD family hydrolase [Anaerolineae bacterium]
MANEQPNFSHITTIIFDMDGTLIEHTWQLEKICEALFGKFADHLAPVTQDQFFDCYWLKSHDMWHMMVDRVLPGEVAAKYAYVNTLRTLGLNPSLAESMLNYWTEIVLEEAVPFEDTFTVLNAVRRKYKTGILTNGYIGLQRKKIERYNLAAYVDFTLVSEEVGYHKPDPRVFIETLKLAGGALPQETLYIGDNLVTDVEGSQAAGMTPILVDVKTQSANPKGVLKINRLGDLLPLLKLQFL